MEGTVLLLLFRTLWILFPFPALWRGQGLQYSTEWMWWKQAFLPYPDLKGKLLSPLLLTMMLVQNVCRCPLSIRGDSLLVLIGWQFLSWMSVRFLSDAFSTSIHVCTFHGYLWLFSQEQNSEMKVSRCINVFKPFASYFQISVQGNATSLSPLGCASMCFPKPLPALGLKFAF